MPSWLSAITCAPPGRTRTGCVQRWACLHCACCLPAVCLCCFDGAATAAAALHAAHLTVAKLTNWLAVCVPCWCSCWSCGRRMPGSGIGCGSLRGRQTRAKAAAQARRWRRRSTPAAAVAACRRTSACNRRQHYAAPLSLQGLLPLPFLSLPPLAYTHMMHLHIAQLASSFSVPGFRCSFFPPAAASVALSLPVALSGLAALITAQQASNACM